MARVTAWAVVMMGVVAASPVRAQAPDPRQPATRQQDLRDRQLKESRYQIGQMERLLEGAVEHGATLIRDRLQVLMPADMLLTENARARGFRLDGYGVFFDVQVPSLEGLLPWSYQTLDQNNLGIDSALKTLRSFIEVAAANDVNLQQALKRVELQVAPFNSSLAAPPNASKAAPNSSATPAGNTPPAMAPDDPILKNPNQVYRSTISASLLDAMLEHSRGLNIAPTEWLTVAARGSGDRPQLAPADPEGQTVTISIRGADLTAFLGGQISREEAIQRVDVRVF